MVTVGTGSARTRFLKTDYPIDEGLTAGTTKLKDDWHLEPEEEDLTPIRDRRGL